MNDHPLSAHRAVAAATHVGSYVLVELLAQGGFGAVYRAIHARRGTLAAVKLLHEDVAGSPIAVHRFEREIAVIGRIQHPNVVQILEHGRDADGAPYLVMELLAGVSLDEHLVRTGPLRVEEMLEILEPLASALEAAHAMGVVHRDIKASNVFLAEEDGRRRVVLLDFGIAKLLDVREPALTSSRDCIGTPACMSPEQICNAPVDARTDVYGLGVLVFRMLAGQLPFRSSIFAVLQHFHLRAPPPSLGGLVPVRPALEAVVLRAMSKDPRDRHSTVGAFAQALRRAMGAPATADAASFVERRVLAVHAEVRGPDAMTPDDLTVDTEAVLQSVMADLAAAGLSVLAATGASVLLRVNLPADPRAEQRLRAAVVEALRVISGAHRARGAGDAGIRVRLSCHVGTIVTTLDEAPVGGDVLDVAGWVSDVAGEGVFASPEVLVGLGILPQDSTGTRGAHLRLDVSADEEGRSTAPCPEPGRRG
jgi:eukaryotic-like serine/threonine-protein kinase